MQFWTFLFTGSCASFDSGCVHFKKYSGLLINPSGSYENHPWYVKNKNGHEKVTEKSPRPLNTTVLLEISPRISWKRRSCELESPKIEKWDPEPEVLELEWKD